MFRDKHILNIIQSNPSKAKIYIYFIFELLLYNLLLFSYFYLLTVLFTLQETLINTLKDNNENNYRKRSLNFEFTANFKDIWEILQLVDINSATRSFLIR